MGYRVDYSTEKTKTGVNRFNIRLPVLVLLCFVGFMFTVAIFWLDGAIVLKEAVAFPRKILPVTDLNCFAEELQCGNSLIASFTRFCREAVS